MPEERYYIFDKDIYFNSKDERLTNYNGKIYQAVYDEETKRYYIILDNNGSSKI